MDQGRLVMLGVKVSVSLPFSLHGVMLSKLQRKMYKGKHMQLNILED